MLELVRDTTAYEKDEKMKTVHLTEPGSEKVEDMLREAGIITEGNLYDIFNVSVVHHVQQSLRAHTLFALDVDYIVRDDKLVLIDEFTGRMMEGRRYSEGLHQALEAKEHVTVQQENQTLATITFQNYFRLFPKLAGMTGTAMTEADEFMEIYKLSAVEIPTNVPAIRVDGDDEVYRTNAEKFDAVTTLIEDAKTRGQPVLVGTVSIEKERAAERASDQTRRAAFGAERALPCAGSHHHRPGRRAGQYHDRHQHGRPRHRHQTRRQCRYAPCARARCERAARYPRGARAGHSRRDGRGA